MPNPTQHQGNRTMYQFNPVASSSFGVGLARIGAACEEPASKQHHFALIFFLPNALISATTLLCEKSFVSVFPSTFHDSALPSVASSRFLLAFSPQAVSWPGDPCSYQGFRDTRVALARSHPQCPLPGARRGASRPR